MKNFFSSMFDSMTPKQKVGAVVAVGGLLLSALGLVVSSDYDVHWGANGFDLSSHGNLGGKTTIDLSDEDEDEDEDENV